MTKKFDFFNPFDYVKGNPVPPKGVAGAGREAGGAIGQSGKQNVEFCKFLVFSGNPGRAGSVLPGDHPASAASVAAPPHHGLSSARLPLTRSRRELPPPLGAKRGESYKN